MNEQNFIYKENQLFLIEEFNFIRKQDYYKKIKNKINVSYKKDLEKFLYYFKVWKETELNSINLKEIHKRGKDYHIDHIIPISFGFNYGINPLLISSIDNIRIISKKENFNKNLQLTNDSKNILKKFGLNYNDLVKKEYNKIYAEKSEKQIVIKFKQEITIENKHRLSIYPIGSKKTLRN